MTKTAIITGASTGIGYGISRLFLEKGLNVVMNSASEQNLWKAYSALGEPGNATIVAGDVSNKDVSQLLVDTAVQKYGALDILVNNAGVFGAKPFLDVKDADIALFYNINFKGTYFAAQAAIRYMVNSDGGSIINIGSVLVDHAVSDLPATAPISIKGAVHAFTRQLAAEFGKKNIRVNAIAPGVIRTALQSKLGIQNADDAANLSLLNRIGEPDDVAEIAYALAINQFMTGEIINIDGGHVAGR